MKKDKYEYIEYEDLSGHLQDICSVVGIVIIRELIRNLQGLQLYVPAFNRLSGSVKRLIKENIDMSSHEIARQYNISEMYVKKIIRELENEKCK